MKKYLSLFTFALLALTCSFSSCSDAKPRAIKLWNSERRGQALLGLSRVVTKQGKAKRA